MSMIHFFLILIMFSDESAVVVDRSIDDRDKMRIFLWDNNVFGVWECLWIGKGLRILRICLLYF